MLTVDGFQVGEQPLLWPPLQLPRRIKVQNPRFLWANNSSLIERWQPAVLPIVDATDR